MDRWRANLYILLTTQLMATMSINFGVPFIPYFIQEIGETDPDRIKMFTALSAALPAIGMGIASPVWGMLADRHGKKPMVIRATLMASLVFIGMGYSANVTQLMVLRLLQGFFTGTVAASNAFIASNIPDENQSFSFGALTSARFLGITAGPAIGGLIAESIGYRASFHAGGALLFLNSFAVMVFLKETRKVIKEEIKKKSIFLSRARDVFTPSILVIMAMLFLFIIARSVFKPYIPLMVQEARGTLTGSAKITGLISAFIAVMTSISGIWLGRMAARRDKDRIILFSLAAGIVISVPLIFANELLLFTLLYSAVMFAIGGIEPLLLTMASERTEPSRRGTLFGYITMISSIAWGLSSLMGSMISIKYSISAILVSIPAILLLMLVIEPLRPDRNKAA